MLAFVSLYHKSCNQDPSLSTCSFIMVANMLSPAADPSMEDDLCAQEVAQVKQWWSDTRWRYTKRPFTAEQIVSKRGSIKIEYPSNTQSKKLWDILEKRFAVSRFFFFFFFLVWHLCCPMGNLAHATPTLMANRRSIVRIRMPATPMAAWSPPW